MLLELRRFLFSFAAVYVILVFSAHSREVQWTFDPPLGNVDSSPAVADLNGDGKDDIVVTTTAGMTLAIDSSGRQIWMSGVQIPISIPPTVVDLMEDSTPEVLVVNQSGRLYCLDGKTGDTIWRYDLPGKIEWGMTAIAAYDLNGDGDLEVIVGDDAGHVLCLSGEGELIWQYEGEHGYAYCPAIGPLGTSTEPLILIGGSKIPLVCLNADGSERWRLQERGDGASPVIADLNGDGQNVVVGALNNSIIAVDSGGEIIWSFETPKAIDGSIAVADADEDGELEIYAVDLSGTLVSLAPDGTKRWTANVGNRVRRSPAIADVDGDGEIEVVVAGYSSEMYVFNGDGELKETLPMVHSTNASPTIADIAGDGTPYVVYASVEGNVQVFKWPEAKAGAKILWPEYRFSSSRGGALRAPRSRSPVRIAAIDFGSLYMGQNSFRVHAENPEMEALRIEVEIRQSGKKTTTRSIRSSDETIEYAFDYSLSSVAPISLTIECRVSAGDTLLAKRVMEAYVVPFQKELQDLARLIDQTEAAARRMPEAFALIGETAEAKTRLADYAQRVPAAGTLTDVERRELRDDLRGDLKRFERLRALSTAAAEHFASGEWPLQVCAANPWAPFGGFDEILEHRFAGKALGVSAFQGEVESAAINIVNWSGGARTVRVEIDPLVNGEGDEVAVLTTIELMEVIAVPTQTLDLSADALPRMNAGHTLTLPGWDVRQLWLSIDTSGLGPGDWRTTVHLRTLEVESKTFSVPLRVHIWDTPLPDTGVLKQCNWGYVYSSRLKEHEAASLVDRVAHGNNVFVTHFAPEAKFDGSGKIVGGIDFTKHDAFVRRYSSEGLILFQNLGGLSGPGGMEGEAYEKAYVSLLRAWVAHLKSMGIGYERYAMYPVDEPGLNEGLVERYLANAKLTRQADPKVRMYTDPVGRITVEELERMLPYVDIWCPNRVGFLLDTGADKLEIMLGSGAEMWNYECEGNAKHQSPLGYYRGQAWLAWSHGLSGIGFWSFCTSAADPWFRPTDTLDYLLVYQGDGVVASKRWESIRDGVEDYATLYALRDASQSSARRGKNEGAVREAEALLENGASSIAKFCGLDEDGTVPGKGGLRRARAVADTRYAAIEAMRKDMARLMSELAK